MKLTFKDLKQQKFIIEAEPSELISSVKEKISQEKGWDAPQQKLIYSGKILQDDKTVEDYKIEEKGFIVCMISKPKAAPSASTPSKAPSTPAPPIASTPAPPAAPAPAASLSTNAVPATPSPAGPTPPADAIATPATGGGLAMGAERAAQIAEMESMGFERSQIDLAMRAAFYNSERAIEYLLTGIPENLQQEQRAAAPAETASSPIPAAANPGAEGGDEPINLFEAAAQAGAGGRGGAGAARGGASAAGAASLLAGAGAGAGAAGGLGNLDFLRNNPQFQQLRQVVQQQPQMLEPILQQVGAGNPQLAALIGQHPEQFLQLLSEDGENDAPLPPGAQAVQVTEEEREAIERLCRLGFPRDLAIQAYFACDKNEELAANFLFDQPEDDE
ncbi:UV excision repair protein [Lachnellula hyalina]|uniref:UV excision repair protein RAD23 n=1 Tax=Lachnellula hyalina TaxID=1316788 RepID=A0A8H8U170_9HELO|nr:UV excision repair protein [Lachnellula hyalina]TVY30086.1 UV excision repair protein [Lachnellula hyalina]